MESATLEPPARHDSSPLLEIPVPDGGTISKDAIRTLSIAGMSDVDILAKFPALKGTTLRQWRFKDPVWSAAFQATRAGKNQTSAQTAVTTKVQQAITSDITKTTIADNLLEMGQQSSLRALQIAHKSLVRAPDELPVLNLGDLKTALSVARIAAGMDREGAEVKVNLAMFQAGAMPETGVSWEVETVADEDSQS